MKVWTDGWMDGIMDDWESSWGWSSVGSVQLTDSSIPAEPAGDVSSRAGGEG